KITVIATGFRREMPERRERMLTASLREPVVPRVDITPQPVRPRFASEEFDEPTPARPVFVEVPAFAEADPEPVAEEPIYQPAHSAANATTAADSFDTPSHDEAAVAVAELPAHPETVVADNHDQGGDNLDIPAFLRRGGL
ncbi:MAG TPA: hypothetical protein VMG10_23735, partial [Gemmataceae bacterium]|nr:hypothetical protein [Gemmataceae bacterium]